MSIPETGYGSWDEFRERTVELTQAGKSGGGVHCECAGRCDHASWWADANGWEGKPNPTREHMRAMSRG